MSVVSHTSPTADYIQILNRITNTRASFIQIKMPTADDMNHEKEKKKSRKRGIAFACAAQCSEMPRRRSSRRRGIGERGAFARVDRQGIGRVDRRMENQEMALEAAALVGCAERRGRSGVRAPRLVGVDDTWGSCARREWTGGG